MTQEGSIGKNLSDKFSIENGLKQGDALSPLLSMSSYKPTINMHFNLINVREFICNISLLHMFKLCSYMCIVWL
jgi:hypothetical protein